MRCICTSQNIAGYTRQTHKMSGRAEYRSHIKSKENIGGNYYSMAQQNKKPAQTGKSAAKPASSAAKKAGADRAGKTAAKRQNRAQSAPQEQPARSPRQPQRRTSGSRRKANGKPLRITPLGGLDEIGKNITLYSYGDDLLLVDCGMTFPDEEMPGIDIVIPDFSYLVRNKDRIRGLVLTHGHEDHIGGIPYLLKQCNIPIYGTRLTLGLVEGKLREHKLMGSAKLNVVRPGDVIRLGAFSVEMIHVNHSIPDAVALAIRCDAGLVVQTGDFKIDTTPIDDQMIDLARFAELGKEGVLALLSDSTNAERPGFTPSERIVGESFSTLFKKAEGHRIIVATFSSNIHRIQQIIDEAVRCGRKVAVSGRSMINVVGIASEMGYLKVPQGVLVDIDLIKRYPADKLVIITTGSQGEPLSALHRMAFSDHRNVEISPDDVIIISATPIPGNEKTVGKVVNELLKRGASVVYEKMYDVHVSGHACQGELSLMLGLVRPRYFIPVHGEQKHLVKHAGLAKQMGIPDDHILIASIGNVIELTQDSIKVVDTVPAGRVLVDGLGVGDVGNIVLRDRKHLSDDGIIIVALSIDHASGEVVSGPEVISRGFVYVKESEPLLEEANEVVCDVLEQCYLANIRDHNAIKGKIRDAVSRFLFGRTRRSPMILPIILDV